MPSVTARMQTPVGSDGAHRDLLAPAGFLTIVIPLIVFLSLQGYFVRGLLAGSVKG
jgi:alpha-glucoside transport system permease protein